MILVLGVLTALSALLSLMVFLEQCESAAGKRRRVPMHASHAARREVAPVSPMFELVAVTKAHFGAAGRLVVLDRLDLVAPSARGVIGIQGPSGCGKTTMLNLLAGLDVPTEGHVRVLGLRLPHDGRRLREYRRRVGLVLQERNLVSHLSARDNVAMPLAMHGVSWSVAFARADRWLAELGLTECAASKPAALSGGQQQRVAIARALAGNARVLLADEPTSALDDASAAQVLTTLRSVADRHGVAVVLVSHDPRTLACCDHVVRFANGSWKASPPTRGAESIGPRASSCTSRSERGLWDESLAGGFTGLASGDQEIPS